MPLSRLIRFGTSTWTYEGWQGRESRDSTEGLVTPSLWTHDHAQRGDARISIPKSHDLLSLYRDLPQSMTTPIEDLYEKTKPTAIGKNAALEFAIASGSVPPEVIGNGIARNPTLRLTIRSKLFWHVQVMHFKRGAISMRAAGMVN